MVGFGATADAWEAHHVQDPNAETGAAYDLDPALTDSSGEPLPRYYTVVQASRITNYEMHLAAGTSLSEAKATVMAELPPDATITSFTVQDTCAELLVHSATLADVAGDVVPEGSVGVEFTSGEAGDHYDGSDVQQLNFVPVTPAELPTLGC